MDPDLDPDWIWIWIRIGIQPKVMDPDQMKTDANTDLSDLSALCVARYLPTGSQVTPLTWPLWPRRTAMLAGAPLTSQTTTVLSTEQVASQRSPGLHARSSTSPSCCRSVCAHLSQQQQQHHVCVVATIRMKKSFIAFSKH